MIPYTPSQQEENEYRDYFLTQATQTGFGFVGDPYQRGAGLGSLFRGLLRSVKPLAKSALKAVGKSAINTGLAVAQDMLEGRDVVDSIKTHSKVEAKRLTKKAQKTMAQRGHGVGRRNTKRVVKHIKGLKRGAKRHKKPNIWQYEEK